MLARKFLRRTAALVAFLPTLAPAALISDFEDTWTDGGTNYLIHGNVTDTSSAADSQLLGLSVGGTDKFYVLKDGTITVTGPIVSLANGDITLTPNGTGNVVVSSDMDVSGDLTAAGTGPSIKTSDTRSALSTNDVIGQLGFYKKDTSNGGVGTPAYIQARTTNSGGTFNLDFITGSVATPVTPLVLDSNGNVIVDEDIYSSTGTVIFPDGAILSTKTNGTAYIRTARIQSSLNEDDIIGALEFYKNDASNGGSGYPVKVQARSDAYGGTFNLDLITGSVDAPVTSTIDKNGKFYSGSDIWAGANKTTVYPSDKNWVVFGDSLSNSFTAGTDWPGDTKNIVGFTGTTTTNAVAGQKVSQQLSVLDTLLAGDANYFDPYDIITLLIGTNDFNGDTPIGTRDDAVGAATFAGTLKDFIETVLTAKPSIRFFLLTPPEKDPYHSSNGAGWTLRQLSVLISQIGSDYGLPVIDLNSMSGMNEQTIATLTVDGTHPNSTETAVIGKIVAEAFAANASIGKSIDTSEPVTFLDTVSTPALQTSTALNTATDGGSTPAFTANTVGSTGGPTTAAQQGWLEAKDSTGATIWIPVWK